jgi:glutamyl-tRNA reductase
MVPLIQAVQSQAELWRADAMSKALRRLTNGEDPQAVMEGLSRMLSSRMMHGVLAGLNDPDTESRQHMAEAAARCFLGASRSSNVSS